MDIDSTVAPNELAISLANKCRKWTYESYSGEYEVNEVPRNPNVDRQYETRLDRAISDIQTKVYAQKRALEELQKKAQEDEQKQLSSIQALNPEAKRLHDLATQIVQLQAMTKTQNHLLHIVSQIPPSESPLNALLTRQNAEAINEQTTETIRDVNNNIADLKEKISRESSVLEESSEISDALKSRLASLRTKSQQTASQYLAELSHQKTAYATSKRMLTQGLQQFIKDHLATILLAESKGALPGEPKSLPKKKRRRDEDEGDENPERAVAARMIALVEELMNQLVSPDGNSAWVNVIEDDVVVRCLVRANIALMHPNDGSKIRLVEFHKEVQSGEMEED